MAFYSKNVFERYFSTQFLNKKLCMNVLRKKKITIIFGETYMVLKLCSIDTVAKPCTIKNSVVVYEVIFFVFIVQIVGLNYST